VHSTEATASSRGPAGGPGTPWCTACSRAGRDVARHLERGEAAERTEQCAVRAQVAATTGRGRAASDHEGTSTRSSSATAGRDSSILRSATGCTAVEEAADRGDVHRRPGRQTKKPSKQVLEASATAGRASAAVARCDRADARRAGRATRRAPRPGTRCEQNDLASTALIARIANRIASAAGCTGWMPPPASHTRSDISARSQEPSTPRGAHDRRAPPMWANAQSVNCARAREPRQRSQSCSATRARTNGEPDVGPSNLPPRTFARARRAP